MRGSTDTKHAVGPAPGKPGIYRVKRALRRDWQLLLLCAVPILYFILFHYTIRQLVILAYFLHRIFIFRADTNTIDTLQCNMKGVFL